MESLNSDPEVFTPRAALMVNLLDQFMEAPGPKPTSKQDVLNRLDFALNRIRLKILGESMLDLLAAIRQMKEHPSVREIIRELYAFGHAPLSGKAISPHLHVPKFGVRGQFMGYLLEKVNPGLPECELYKLIPPYACIFRDVFSPGGDVVAEWRENVGIVLSRDTLNFLFFYDSHYDTSKSTMFDYDDIKVISRTVMTSLAQNGIGLPSEDGSFVPATNGNDIRNVPALLKLASHKACNQSWSKLQKQPMTDILGSFVLRWFRHMCAHNPDYMAVNTFSEVGIPVRVIWDVVRASKNAIWSRKKHKPDANDLPERTAKVSVE